MPIRKINKFVLVGALVLLNSLSVFALTQQTIEENNFLVYSKQIQMTMTDPDVDQNLTNQSFNEQLGIVDSIADIDISTQVIRAMSNSEYPVTPGDIFSLSYKASNELITFNVQVDGNYNLDIPGFDAINVKGFNFFQLKTAVVDLIEQYYPFSTARLYLTSTGNFTVTVKGEVESTTEIPCWGLSRLSDVTGIATKYASSRAIKIVSKDGISHTYDLYAALKEGDLTQNPLLKSGDVVIIPKASRIVTISGEVYRPGTYQLLNGENLNDLIVDYAGGLLTSADKSKLTVSRYNNETGIYDQKKVQFDSDTEILNQDVVMVESVRKIYDSITVEGAISSAANTNTNTTATILGAASGKLLYYFVPGEKLSLAVESISSRFTSSSDLKNSYIKRDGKRIDVDLLKLLSGDLSQDMSIMASDELVIPFDQKFVNVQGAVTKASSYAYTPDKTVNYYISLAGGETQYATGTIKLYDKNGNKLDNDSIVPSESTIVVVKSNFTTNLATTATIVGLIYTTAELINEIQDIF
ncbi:MAG: SLBB domain-containing protein [Sphaerochaeta sp.]